MFEKTDKIEENKNILIFISIILVLYVIHLFLLFVVPKSHQLSIFFAECNDFFADFFNIIRFSSNYDVYLNPIGKGLTCYLPLSYMLLLPFLKLEDYSLLTLNGCWNSPVAMISAVFFLLISLILFVHSLYCLLRKYKISKLLMIPFLIGNITLFSIERCNWILITAACVFYFFTFYDNENKGLKYFAATNLVIASVLKIYPVLFGIFLLNKREYKVIIYCVVLGILLTFLPFFSFRSGLKAIPTYIETLKLNSFSYSTELNPKFGLPYLCYWFGKVLEKFSGVPNGLSISLLKFSTYLIRIACIYSIVLFFMIKDDFYRFILLVFAALFFPSHSEYYCGLYLYPSLILFFISMNKRAKWENVLWFILYVLLFQDIQISYKGIINMTRLLVDMASLVAFLFILVRCSFILSKNHFSKNKLLR